MRLKINDRKPIFCVAEIPETGHKEGVGNVADATKGHPVKLSLRVTLWIIGLKLSLRIKR